MWQFIGKHWLNRIRSCYILGKKVINAYKKWTFYFYVQSVTVLFYAWFCAIYVRSGKTFDWKDLLVEVNTLFGITFFIEIIWYPKFRYQLVKLYNSQGEHSLCWSILNYTLGLNQQHCRKIWEHALYVFCECSPTTWKHIT